MSWLPITEEHRALAVPRQDADPHSVRNGFRTLMHWRKSPPALCLGDIRFVDTAVPVLAFTRRLNSQAMLAVFHLADSAAAIELPQPLGEPTAPEGHGLKQGHLQGRQLRLPGYGICVARVG